MVWTPIQTILEGAFDTVMVISFCMWVNLEAIKFSLFGMNTALMNDDVERAEKIWNETGIPGRDALWYWLAVYSMGRMPNWTAYAIFYTTSRILLFQFEDDIAYAKEQNALGKHRQKDGSYR